MSESITTSIRLEPKLRRALEQKAKQEKRGKNWIISRALESYLEHDSQFDLEVEEPCLLTDFIDMTTGPACVVTDDDCPHCGNRDLRDKHALGYYADNPLVA